MAYLIDADNVGQEGKGLDLGGDEVRVQLFVVQLVLPEIKMMPFVSAAWRKVETGFIFKECLC